MELESFGRRGQKLKIVINLTSINVTGEPKEEKCTQQNGTDTRKYNSRQASSNKDRKPRVERARCKLRHRQKVANTKTNASKDSGSKYGKSSEWPGKKKKTKSLRRK